MAAVTVPLVCLLLGFGAILASWSLMITGTALAATFLLVGGLHSLRATSHWARAAGMCIVAVSACACIFRDQMVLFSPVVGRSFTIDAEGLDEQTARRLHVATPLRGHDEFDVVDSWALPCEQLVRTEALQIKAVKIRHAGGIPFVNVVVESGDSQQWEMDPSAIERWSGQYADGEPFLAVDTLSPWVHRRSGLRALEQRLLGG